MNRILQRFRENEARVGVERAVAKALVDAGEVVTNPWAMPLDAHRIRGIPAVGGHSLGSAIPGTRPDRDAPTLRAPR